MHKLTNPRVTENNQLFVKSLGHVTKLKKHLVKRFEHFLNVAYIHGTGFVLDQVVECRCHLYKYFAEKIVNLITHQFFLSR